MDSTSNEAPQRIATAILVEETVVWCSRKVQNWTGSNIGTLMDKVLSMRVQGFFNQATNLAQKPIKYIGESMLNTVPQRHRETFRTLIASPVLEELMYRFGIQGGLAFVLTSAGVPSPAAKTIAIGIASFMFGMSHNPDIRQDRFVSTMISGVMYGAVKEAGGISQSIAAHVCSNILVKIKERLNIIN